MSAPPHLCACGCGQPTEPYTRSDTRRGRVKGESARYVQGHFHARPLDPVTQPRMKPDEILDEWEHLRGEVRWVFFHERVGLTLKSWQSLYHAAAERGDPRAVRHPRDEPVKHWRAS